MIQMALASLFLINIPHAKFIAFGVTSSEIDETFLDGERTTHCVFFQPLDFTLW